MKTQATRTSILKNIFSAIAIAAVLLVGTSAKAATNIETPIAQAKVQFLGEVNSNQLLFSVSFENKTEKPVYLTIRDNDGYVFYRKAFYDKQFSKKFMLNKEEISNANLTFVITTEDGEQVQSFKIDTNVTENTVVTTL